MSAVFSTIHGSHLYGLSHEGSDRDVYCVTDGSGRKARHHAGGNLDTVHIPLDVFLIRVMEGSHQALEALFSPLKEWNQDFVHLQPMIETYRAGGAGTFAKYERTIGYFCHGEFKRRRHAVRVSQCLEQLRRYGRFNPVMTEEQKHSANQVALRLEGADLKKFLLEGMPA